VKRIEDQTPGLSPETERLSRSVVQNQLLFSAGYALTTGGFLYYFAGHLGAGTRTISILLALPELVGVLAVFTPALLILFRNRKRLFVASSILARLFTFLIPAAALLPDNSLRLPVIIGALAGQGILQAVAFTAYLSWLSDLAPERNWGRFFARRDIARLAVLIVVPLLATSIKSQLRTSVDFWETLGYVGVFVIGNLLQLVSLIPLLKWPAVLIERQASGERPAEIESPQLRPPLRAYLGIVLFSWWLSFFQGLTQTAFFLITYRQLELSLRNYYLLTGTMYALQMFAAAWAGRIGDRFGYRDLLLWSTVLVATSIPCWMFSLNGDPRWLIPAYMIWGLFGAVNLALQNLLLKVTPRHRNTFHLAFCRQGAGLIAGLTGLAGGFWLDSQINPGGVRTEGPAALEPFLILLLISFLGRILAPAWLLLIPRRVGR